MTPQHPYQPSKQFAGRFNAEDWYLLISNGCNKDVKEKGAERNTQRKGRVATRRTVITVFAVPSAKERTDMSMREKKTIPSLHLHRK